MELTITFLAGCINKQSDFPKESHYHELLKKSLSCMYSIDLNFNFAVYHAYRHLSELVTSLISKKKPDILVVLIRPFPFVILNKPLIKYEKNNKQKVRVIHPSLINRNKFDWPEKYYINIKEVFPFLKIPQPKFGLRDLNLLAGIMVGLHKWASTFVLKELRQVISLCRQESIELIFLGMPQNRESVVGSHLCSCMNKKLCSEFSKTPVSYLNIHSLTDKDGQSNFYEDGIHFNKTGHIFLKENLLPPICKIINEKYGL